MFYIEAKWLTFLEGLIVAVGWNAVHGDHDREFEYDDSFIVQDLRDARYGYFLCMDAQLEIEVHYFISTGNSTTVPITTWFYIVCKTGKGFSMADGKNV